MDEFVIAQQAEDQLSSPAKWKGTSALHLAYQMNEQCIDLFCELAIEQSSELQWPFLVSNRDLWSRLDAEARRKLTTFPYVIVDVRFGDESWWKAVDCAKPAARSAVATSRAMPASRCEYLALEALMFAWQVAREDRRVAHMVFGMAFEVAERIAALSMQQIRTIAIQSSPVLCARWSGKPKFWRELLLAAKDANDDAFSAVRHQAGRRYLRELRYVGGY